MRLTTSNTLLRNPPNSRTTLRVSMSTTRTTRSSHIAASSPLSRCNVIDTEEDGRTSVCCNSAVWKSKNYRKQNEHGYNTKAEATHVDSPVESAGDDNPVQRVTRQAVHASFLPFCASGRTGALLHALRNRSDVERLALEARLHVIHMYRAS